jgi:Cof subfamily protein (haloacid dehalogenase superfamily)
VPQPASAITKSFTLAAIDLDGTLLDGHHAISPANADAVRRLQAAGVQVVLASGRHFVSMHKYAAALPGVQWVVSCQGGEVASTDRSVVLHRQFMTTDAVRQVMTAGRQRGFTVVAYAIEGMFTPDAWNADMDFYTALAGLKPVIVSPADILSRQVFKVIWMGEPAAVAALPANPIAEATIQSVQSVHTNSRFLEFMPVTASKAAALQLLADHLKLSAAVAVAFGDGDNDVPMFEWAGTSVAMPHGSPLALKKASRVAPAGSPATAFARAVDLVLPKPAVCERCGAFEAMEIGGEMLCADCIAQAGCGCAGHPAED